MNLSILATSRKWLWLPSTNAIPVKVSNVRQSDADLVATVGAGTVIKTASAKDPDWVPVTVAGQPALDPLDEPVAIAAGDAGMSKAMFWTLVGGGAVVAALGSFLIYRSCCSEGEGDIALTINLNP